MSNLRNIKFQSQNTFSGVSETADDTLYFVEAVALISANDYTTDRVRIFSDKWCEQYGQTASVAAGSSVTVSLRQTYKDISYVAFAIGLGESASSANSNSVITSKSQGSFTIYNGSSKALSFMWEAKGYIN